MTISFADIILRPVCEWLRSQGNAFYIGNTYYTYRQLAERISAIRCAVHDWLSEENIVALAIHDDIDTYATVFALWMEGKAYVPLHPNQPIERIFEFLGCKTYYFPRYFMGEKNINANSVKGKLALIKQRCQKWWHNRHMPSLPQYDYTLSYLNNVDDESYDFICKHCTEHFFHSSQSVFNWLVQYPWSISTPLTLSSFVQVWSKGQLVGVYRLQRNENKLTCNYIYYDKASAEIVFASVVEHILSNKATHFDTEDGNLAVFVRKYVYFPKSTTEQLSLSIASSIPVPKHFVR